MPNILVTRLAKHLLENEVYLATGERLTVEMLQLLGINIGMVGPESVYYLLDRPSNQLTFRTVVNPLFFKSFRSNARLQH